MANPRKPTMLKLVSGTARPGRLNPNEPQPDIEIPSCPAALSPAAKAEWRRVSPLLEDQGLLSKQDRAVLAAYCELYARWTNALKQIQEHGEVIKTPLGSIQVSPWMSIARSAEKELRMYAALFGMSPADRSKVNATDTKKQTDKKDRFFS